MRQVEKDLDSIVSKVVRLRSGLQCEYCYRQVDDIGYLHCSHYKGRWRGSARWDMDNLVALCPPCHKLLDDNKKTIYTDWKRKQLGGKRFGYLTRKANTPKKWTQKELEQLYSEYKAKLERLNNEK